MNPQHPHNQIYYPPPPPLSLPIPQQNVQPPIPPSPPHYTLPQTPPQYVLPHNTGLQPPHSPHTPQQPVTTAANPTPPSVDTSYPYVSASQYNSSNPIKPAVGPEDAAYLYALLGIVLGFLLGPICFFFLCAQRTLGMRGRRKTFFVWGTVVGLILLVAAAVSAWFIFIRDDGFDLD